MCDCSKDCHHPHGGWVMPAGRVAGNSAFFPLLFFMPVRKKLMYLTILGQLTGVEGENKYYKRSVSPLPGYVWCLQWAHHMNSYTKLKFQYFELKAKGNKYITREIKVSNGGLMVIEASSCPNMLGFSWTIPSGRKSLAFNTSLCIQILRKKHNSSIKSPLHGSLLH